MNSNLYSIAGINCSIATLGAQMVRGEEEYIQRIINAPVTLDINYFISPHGESVVLMSQVAFLIKA